MNKLNLEIVDDGNQNVYKDLHEKNVFYKKANCKICNAKLEIRKTIEEWKEKGYSLREIAEMAKNDFGFKISQTSVRRHFVHLNEWINKQGKMRLQEKLESKYGKMIEDSADTRGVLQTFLVALSQHATNNLSKFSFNVEDIIEIAKFLEIDMKNGKTESKNDLTKMLAKMEVEQKQLTI